MIVAEIIFGAVAGSTAVQVQAAVSNGTAVVVYRGGLWIGQGTIASGICFVNVQRLATGDIIQASVRERGNQAGVPIIVSSSDQQPTGWLKPTTVRVTNPDGSISNYARTDYENNFGEKLGSSYDPAGAGLTRTPAEYDPGSQPELGFDVVQTLQPGQTTLQVVARGNETILVGWNGAAVGTNAPFTVTTGGTVSVSVQRDDFPGVLTRTLSVMVLAAPSPAAPSNTDIVGLAFRIFDVPGGYLVQLHINSAKSCEATLSGFTSNYQPGTFYGSNYQEVPFSVVPPGTYTGTARVVGDGNAANYKSIVLTV